MTQPVETVPLPPSIATVKVMGQYRGPDGRGLQGTVTFTGPGLLTFPDADLFIAGPVVARLDEFGRIVDAAGNLGIILPATDNGGMNPSGWSYTVKENLTGVTGARTYALLLPKGTPGGKIDLADVAPADPTTPNYVPVPGPSAYDVAVQKGFTGTEAQWLTSLIGPVGAPGNKIWTGSTSPSAGTGIDGDVFFQRATTTFLGVDNTAYKMWSKAGGVWSVASADVRGPAIYVNNTTTDSTSTKAGDVLFRSDTGDVYQRDASGWGTPKGNLKGPKGDTGATGSTGATGAQGLPGVVQSVNGVSAADVVIDLGSVVAKGATASGPVTLGYSSGVALTMTGNGNTNLAEWKNPSGTLTTRIGSNGNLVAQGASYFVSGLQLGSTSTDFGGAAGGVLGIDDAVTVPTTNPTGGVVVYSQGGALKVRQADGTVVSVGSGGTGAVSSVNTKTGDVVLSAADVSAVPTSEKGAASGVATLDASTKIPTAQIPSLTSTYVAVSTRGAANGVATLDAAGDVPIAQIPNVARNTWTPQALGFQAWSFDPGGVANPAAKYLTPQRLYLTGFNITESTTVTKVVLFARGYGGVSTNRYMAGIYKEDGTRVVASSAVALTMAGQETGALPPMVSNHIGAVPLTITSTTLAPGRYWVAWLMTTGGTADFSFYHVQNEAPVATANFFMTTTPFARAWYLAAQSTLPTTVSQTNAAALADHDIPIVALA
jgi:hypothetical protein